jgi:hypothetical protein
MGQNDGGSRILESGDAPRISMEGNIHHIGTC